MTPVCMRAKAVVHGSIAPRAVRAAFVARGALLALAIVLMIGGAALACARWAPAWWNPAPAAGAEQDATARALEQWIAAQLSLVRGPGVVRWRMRLRAEDVNAWLAVRLPQWLEFDRSLPWPAGVEAPHVAFDGDGLHGAVLRDGWVLSSTWRVETEEETRGADASGGDGGGEVRGPGDKASAGAIKTRDGRAPAGAARLVHAGARVGRLPLPFAEGAGALLVPELARPVLLETRLGDGRVVRVVSAELGAGEVVLDLETRAGG